MSENATGLLVLMGGDEFRRDCIPMDRALLARIPSQPPRVVIVPTAAAHESPRIAARNGTDYFISLGSQVSSAMIVERADANDQTFSHSFAEADVIYLTGGDPGHLLHVMLGSRVWDAIVRRWQDGAMLIGSSAGAMVMGGRMRGELALGLAQWVIVQPHFPTDPRSQLRARSVAGSEMATFGIPTATCCASADGIEWEVIGAASVAVDSEGAVTRYAPGEHFRMEGR